MSLADLNYEIPLIGFSGDSNTPIPPPGWETAKIIAKENGPKLHNLFMISKINVHRLMSGLLLIQWEQESSLAV